ncbi:MAG: extracellular solute-binding protein [Patescibacteria group bacterium]|nr:extracellular solute-binding protein [Patescibacteria group bacterium]MDD4303961.1 extracellular solute-binding protein [Patescibacteria group bacterium]MDD4695050.1 extracellular solute-binding protein [Patescibacteria group bacterium]
MKKNILNKSKIKKILLFLIFTLIITSGFGCTNNIFKKQPAELKPVTIKVWGVYEDRANLQPLFDAYSVIHPNVRFNYRVFSYDEYENQLISAWAEDNGPDIYFLPNNWLRKMSKYITPMPETAQLPYRDIKSTGIGGFKKTDIIDYVKETKMISLNEITKNFAPVVFKDNVIDNKIYGLPLSIDTMAMFYNKDMLNNVNIPLPPSTWTDFKNAVKVITLLNEDGKFLQSGSALGTTNNITNSADIVMLLIQQNGITVGDGGFVNFGKTKDEINLTLQAINFYSDFSNPIKEVYSWNEEQDNSLEAFINGQVGFFFGYPYHIQQIKSRAPKLNFGISEIPQIENTNNPINFADYWVMTVSHKTESSDVAWGFIDFATKKENAKIYLDQTHKPTALNSLIGEQLNDLEIGPFSKQILTAKSWYQGKNPEIAEKYINEMINSIKNGSLEKPENIIQTTAGRINQTIQ